MSVVHLSVPVEKNKLPRWDRSEATATLAAYEQRPAEKSQREFARDKGVARGTLQHWKARKDGLDADPVVVEFFESPQGLTFLHRLVAAVHFVFGQIGPCGVRLVSLFLLLSRLDRVVAASRGSQHKVAVAMEQLIVEFGGSERERLGKDMAPRTITLCEDETFHRGRMCLVGIEALSNFIVLETYSARREEKSWTTRVLGALEGLKVEVAQAVGDEARGLIAHARNGLGVEHGPDLFHVQYEMGKGTAAPLAKRVQRAEEKLEKIRAEVQKHLHQHGSPDPSQPGAEGHTEAPGQRLAPPAPREQQALDALRKAEAMRFEAQEAIRAVGQCYHPVRLEDGRLRSAAELEEELNEQFDRIEGVALISSLSESCWSHIAKARRLIPKMVATMALFFERMRLALAPLELEPPLDALVRDKLVPGLYLQRVAEQAKGAERKAELRGRAAQILAEARAASGPLHTVSEERRDLIEHTARRCAEMFVRSSSCTEGRNGQLALHYQSSHRLSDRKLAVLTTIHDYLLRRPDGTTAAERFFGSKPQDLFEWLLDRLDLPARPAKKRPRKPFTLL
jgi:hypothetical protein